MAMFSPAFALCLLLGSLYGLAFFFLFGRKEGRIIAYWVVGIAAFLAGQLVGAYHPFSPLMLGEIHLVEASIASALGLLVAYWRKI